MSGLWLEPHRDRFGTAGGFLVRVPGNARSPPVWRCELATRQDASNEWTIALRIMRGEEPLAWLRLDDWWSNVEVLLADRSEVSAVGPLRAAELRSLGPAPSEQTWAAFFVERLAQSVHSPLHAGTWWLREPDADDPVVAPRVDDLQLTELAFTDFSFGNRVLHLRRASAEDDARIKVWRKHCRDGALPPVLLLYQSALNAYLVLDGHDRLLASRIERARPRYLVLSHVHRVKLPAPPDAPARLEAIDRELKKRRPDARVIDGVNRAVLGLNATEELVERSRVWPIRGGLERWRSELAAQRLATTDDAVRRVIDELRVVPGASD